MHLGCYFRKLVEEVLIIKVLIGKSVDFAQSLKKKTIKAIYHKPTVDIILNGEKL